MNANYTQVDVYYRKIFYNYYLSKLDNIRQEKIYIKNDIDYINKYIEILKDRVIRKLPNVNLVKVELEIYDENNVLHKFIYTIQDLLEIKKISTNKLIVVCIKYNNEIVFFSLVDFTNL